MKKQLGENWGVDSNIIIYALDNKSIFFKEAEIFFSFFLKKHRINLYIAHQNILEVEKVFIDFYRLKREKVIKTIQSFLEVYNFIVISPLPTTLSYYHKLIQEKNKKIDLFDYYLAATYLDNKINNLFTINVKNFSFIKELNIINPFKKY